MENYTSEQSINTSKVQTMEKAKRAINRLSIKNPEGSLRLLARWSFEPYRLMTSSLRLMPNFIIIGSQKGGTTSLYRYLTQHPHVKSAVTKELHFFDVNFDKGSDWYRSRFPLCTQEFLTGEASPSYIFHPHAPKRIAELTPSVKLIALLRNPVDRAYSHYKDNLRKKKENISFEAAIEKELESLSGGLERMLKNEEYANNGSYLRYSYLGRGIYVDQLTKWFKLFSKEQFLILKSEDFYTNPVTCFDRVLEFLKLPEWQLEEYKQFNSNSELKNQAMKAHTRKQLIDYYKPHNQRLSELLGMSFDWER
jgi:hypothetical protein